MHFPTTLILLLIAAIFAEFSTASPRGNLKLAMDGEIPKIEIPRVKRSAFRALGRRPRSRYYSLMSGSGGKKSIEAKIKRIAGPPGLAQRYQYLCQYYNLC